MTDNVRVRFAPSPTGEPHIGNMRTALFTWLFARRHGGVFMLRIEDTDQSRVVDGSVRLIMEALRWLSLDWDEGPEVGGDYGPYLQSERLDLYHETAQKLIARGKAYKCYCTPERLTEMREEQRRNDQPQRYDRRCRNLTDEERAETQASGAKPVIRFAMPLEGTTTVDDVILGEVSWQNDEYDDFVMIKSDQFPTYHLASVVDDHVMDISHVLRGGGEWLSSTPRHIQIYEAMGWEQPRFAHLPTILGPDRSKLSKRHGATAALEYRSMGYLPQAMANFLALLGWSLDDKTELMSVDELTNNFSLERVSKSPSIFNSDKLDWMNGQYIRSASSEELADALLDFWHRYPPKEIPDLPDKETLLPIVPLIQERLKTLRDAAPRISFFFEPTVDYETDELVQKAMDLPGTKSALERSLAVLEELNSFDSDSIERVLRPLADDLGIKTGQLLGSLRVATTGLKVAPPLFETMEVLGRERSLEAVREAVERL